MTEPSPAAVEATPGKSSGLKKFFKITLALVLLFMVGVLAIAATKPATFHVERSILVKAGPEKITPHINDFHKWGAWSPWEKLDPDMKRVYSGADTGVGAKYAWDGDANVGAGHMEITESTPEKVVMNLNFTRPMEGHNIAEFHMAPEADGTKLTWVMHGPNTFIGKVIQVFCNMEDMISQPFDEGLGKLKTLAETP